MTAVSYKTGNSQLAIMDSNLESNNSQTVEIKIDNFAFNPGSLIVPAGAKVTWTNHDDIPHNVISTNKLFASPVLDTGETFSHVFETAGEYPYYCSIHPKMTAALTVK